MKKKVLITVKTYPTLSKTYGELVCTAGIDEDGNWVRLYPIPFRKLYDTDSQYEKYRWIEVDARKNTDDPRIESHKIDYHNIKILEKISTANDWRDRKEIIFKSKIFSNMEELISLSKKTNMSLATFKPVKVIDFIWEIDNREYSQEILNKLEADSRQGSLFADKNESIEDFKVVDKLPYKFSYIFVGEDNKQRTLMIEDWEVGAAFWSFCKRYKNEELALEKMKEKFLGELANKKDLHFFLGTTRKFHGYGRNPFIIIGVFYPPKETQPSLFG